MNACALVICMLSALCNDFSQKEEFQKFDDYAVDTLVAEFYRRGAALLRRNSIAVGVDGGRPVNLVCRAKQVAQASC